MVRLKGDISGLGSDDQVCFNSNMVRLKATYALNVFGTIYSFNSNMVRLKV